jgi:hypothetical protein
MSESLDRGKRPALPIQPAPATGQAPPSPLSTVAAPPTHRLSPGDRRGATNTSDMDAAKAAEQDNGTDP